ncbi:3-oxoacyl-[acyl-carrier-protein] synthase 2 [Pirellulimonas nuda]|uniref:3-oxoacyl-[acyl-carrier-protein] synthase 2 n=1 Tax=Pirellulimonas nuda TaxID=2528009 RepID=A0A518DJR1_9BACT|nr:beta-ketoacyl synthase N-terminal-like domain-containing protein [Pirellulimonas nuda]QDU91718.1 3-oxoacyl-[acyl-carrier-protein] synthase 2 [Pirellulimonas nuda]
MEDVVITGLGLVTPIGVGRDEVWASLRAGRTGIRHAPALADAGWPAPFGGTIEGFDAKQFVTPRKSLKVMAQEIQFAFAAAEQAWADAGLEDGSVEPERLGVVCGAGFLFSDFAEMEAPYRATIGDEGFEYDRWGKNAMGEFFPLWMLKYLPNMSACHIGIRRDARGPNNTILSGEVSSLLALGEAAAAIRRGVADVMITGGSSSRLHLADLAWRGMLNASCSDADPAKICRPFDAGRSGQVFGEGAAILVLESASHARRRGRAPLARVRSVASRCEGAVYNRQPTGRAVEQAIGGALELAGAKPSDIGLVKAHGVSTRLDDIGEARAIRSVLGDVPVTAPKSFLGNIDAAGSAVELAVTLIGAANGRIPATLNYETPDPACPVNVMTEPIPADFDTFLAVNFNSYGQAAAAVIDLG